MASDPLIWPGKTGPRRNAVLTSFHRSRFQNPPNPLCQRGKRATPHCWAGRLNAPQTTLKEIRLAAPGKHNGLTDVAGILVGNYHGHGRRQRRHGGALPRGRDGRGGCARSGPWNARDRPARPGEPGRKSPGRGPLRRFGVRPLRSRRGGALAVRKRLGISFGRRACRPHRTGGGLVRPGPRAAVRAADRRRMGASGLRGRRQRTGGHGECRRRNGGHGRRASKADWAPPASYWIPGSP